MRAAAALAAIALLTACSRDPSPPSARPETPHVRLLSLADVPAGFRVERDESSKPQEVVPPFRPPDCVQRPGTTTAPKALRVLVRGVTRVVQTVTVHASVEDARADLASVGPQPGCPSVTARAPGNPDVVNAAPSLLPDPRIGDESRAVETSGGRSVAFRRGNVLVVVSVTNVAVDTDVVALARRAFALLDG